MREVVRDVSLTIHTGEFVALLGPNGAGKSTLTKMLTGILVPSKGELLVHGRVPHQHRQRNAYEIGAVFGQRTQLWWDLPAVESLCILRDIYGVPNDVYRRRLHELDDMLALAEFWQTPVRHLSLGQRVRCDLAATLIHEPRTLFLDEPTIGMDILVKEQVREFLRRLVDSTKTTVILATHDMNEVARLCRRLLLLDYGCIIFDGSVDELRRKLGRTVVIHVAFPTPQTCVDVPGATIIESTPLRATLSPAAGVDHRNVVRQLVAERDVIDLRVEESSVEDLVRDAYRHSHRQSALARAS